jgi:hypothetical protein
MALCPLRIPAAANSLVCLNFGSGEILATADRSETLEEHRTLNAEH